MATTEGLLTKDLAAIRTTRGPLQVESGVRRGGGKNLVLDLFTIKQTRELKSRGGTDQQTRPHSELDAIGGKCATKKCPWLGGEGKNPAGFTNSPTGESFLDSNAQRELGAQNQKQ